MPSMVKMIGEKTFAKNLQLMGKKKKRAYLRGLKKAGLRLQRESQLVVPVDTGNLKNSAFTRVIGNDVVVGYTAHYAIYVHENIDMKWKGKNRPRGKGKYWDPQGRGRSKFLEAPLRELKDLLLAIIAAEVRGVK